MKWRICVVCDDEPMGPDVPATEWDVWARLAALRDRMPPGWNVEAFPEVN